MKETIWVVDTVSTVQARDICADKIYVPNMPMVTRAAHLQGFLCGWCCSSFSPLV